MGGAPSLSCGGEAAHQPLPRLPSLSLESCSPGSGLHDLLTALPAALHTRAASGLLHSQRGGQVRQAGGQTAAALRRLRVKTGRQGRPWRSGG